MPKMRGTRHEWSPIDGGGRPSGLALRERVHKACLIDSYHWGYLRLEMLMRLMVEVTLIVST